MDITTLKPLYERYGRDIVQEALCRALKYNPTILETGKAIPYLVTVCKHEISRVQRRHIREQEAIEGFYAGMHPAPDVASLHECAEIEGQWEGLKTQIEGKDYTSKARATVLSRLRKTLLTT